MTKRLRRGGCLVASAVVLLVGAGVVHRPAVAAGDDITGVVTSASGPEAGVWVIAETDDTPTKLVKIVVTDDDGRYLLPELPDATYDVWVRGYGLVDSPTLTGHPGQELALRAVLAPTSRDAAKIYPANYWYSLNGNVSLDVTVTFA